jgi:hypothetical protein
MVLGFQPGVQFSEWLWLQLVDTTIGYSLQLNYPCFKKNTKMFGHLRLVEPKPIGDFPHGERAFAQ